MTAPPPLLLERLWTEPMGWAEPKAERAGPKGWAEPMGLVEPTKWAEPTGWTEPKGEWAEPKRRGRSIQGDEWSLKGSGRGQRGGRGLKRGRVP